MRPPRARPTWARRFLLALTVASVCSVVGAAVSTGYVRWRLSQVERLPGLPVDDLAGLGPMNVLIVGSDDRAVVAGEESSFGSAGEVEGRRSDTIMLARVDPIARTVALLSIPRDTYVTLDGGGPGGTGVSPGKAGRINGAFTTGGATGLIRTISRNFGVPVNHYVEVDFSGFRGLVDAVGGVDLWMPKPVRDWDLGQRPPRNMTGLDIGQTGCVSLDGQMALSYVRSRHLQTLETTGGDATGRWVSDPSSDLGRTERQQRFLIALAKEAKAKATGLRPRATNRMLGEAVKLVAIDDAFSSSELLRLMARFRQFNPDQVEMLGPLPTVRKIIRKADLQVVDQKKAAPLLARFLRPAPAAPAPAATPATAAPAPAPASPVVPPPDPEPLPGAACDG